MDTAVVRYIKKLNFKNKTLSFSLLKELCPDNGDYNSSCTSSACQCGKNRGLLCQNGRCLYKKKILAKYLPSIQNIYDLKKRDHFASLKKLSYFKK